MTAEVAADTTADATADLAADATSDTASATRGRAAFHTLTVADVQRLTDDSAAITFAVPDELRSAFAFAPGQTLTLRRGGERRSYSICAPRDATPRVGVREVAGGALSGWLVHELAPGDTVEVQTPTGTFTPDLDRPADHVLIAAGSGITPMLSIAASVLADGQSTVTLLYGNRRSDTVMFLDEIADLKDAYPSRLNVIHVLSREAQEVELYNGRLDRDRLAVLLPVTVQVEAIDAWWLCGPFGMVEDAIALLTDLGVQRDRIHRELFWVGDQPPVLVSHPEAQQEGVSVTVVLDGRSSTITVPAGSTVLEGAQHARPDLPFACRGGVCGTCRARVTAGSATMLRNYALEDDEVDDGYVLTCQTVPTSPDLVVDYDA